MLVLCFLCKLLYMSYKFLCYGSVDCPEAWLTCLNDASLAFALCFWNTWTQEYVRLICVYVWNIYIVMCLGVRELISISHKSWNCEWKYFFLSHWILILCQLSATSPDSVYELEIVVNRQSCFHTMWLAKWITHSINHVWYFTRSMLSLHSGAATQRGFQSPDGWGWVGCAVLINSSLNPHTNGCVSY